MLRASASRHCKTEPDFFIWASIRMFNQPPFEVENVSRDKEFTVENLDQFEVVIGLEIHVELLTISKMFCGCSAVTFGAKPNTLVCPVCLGFPGSLPVTNGKAVEYTVRTGLALNSSVCGFCPF